MQTKFKDANGNIINYGDILKWLDFPRGEGENYVAESYMMIVKYDENKDMMYMSGMDEFTPIKEWQTKEDEKENKISCVKIYVNRELYEANFKFFEDENS